MSLAPSKLRTYFKRLAAWAEAFPNRITHPQWLAYCSNEFPSEKCPTHIPTHTHKHIHMHIHTNTNTHGRTHTHIHTRALRTPELYYYNILSTTYTMQIDNQQTVNYVHTVPTGGVLFEYFMMTTAGYSNHRTFSSLDDDPQSDTDKRKAIVDNNTNTFIGWIIFHIASLGTNGRRQLFYHTFLSHYYGLSRNGIECLHRFGFMCALTNFDSMRQEVLHESIENTRYCTLTHTPPTEVGSVLRSFSYGISTKIQIKKKKV